jgi:hypothetical protein
MSIDEIITVLTKNVKYDIDCVEIDYIIQSLKKMNNLKKLLEDAFECGYDLAAQNAFDAEYGNIELIRDKGKVKKKYIKSILGGMKNE